MGVDINTLKDKSELYDKYNSLDVDMENTKGTCARIKVICEEIKANPDYADFTDEDQQAYISDCESKLDAFLA